MKNIIFILAIIPACKSSDAKSSANAEPCDTALPALSAKLDAKDTALVGKTIGLKDCKFSGQGNDAVWIKSSDDKERHCYMAGGADGNKKFRHAAMEFDMKKLKLDVTAKIADKDGALELTECNIKPHE